MRIIIAGAGDIGFHLAELLSYENKDIILIDNNKDVLKYASTHVDVLPIRGDSSSIEVLREAEVGYADLFIAVTTAQDNNIVSALLAKQMGAKRCIARVQNSEYIEEEQLDYFKQLGIDSIIAPNKLAAVEIERLLQQCTFTDIFEFEDGKMSLLGATLNSNSSIVNQTIGQIFHPEKEIPYRPMAVLRSHKTLIPQDEVRLLKGDHVYFISPQEHIDDLEETIGKEKHAIKNVMIVGGSDVAFETAKRLQNTYRITLIEPSKKRCRTLAEKLSNTLIVQGNPSNTDILKEEGLEQMDALLALTTKPETNIVVCLTAKNFGVHRTIAKVDNKAYTHISQEIGIDTLINKKLIAANEIFRYIRKGKVECITGLNGVDAEVIEYVVDRKSRLTRKLLKDIDFPVTARIGGVVRADESFIPKDDFQLQKDDKVIVLAMPQAIPQLEKLFR
ncbi:MAG: Trk system potassium transporter TrkA [Bacteroidota bacterium]